MKRTLTLRSELLTSLSDGDLAEVAGGATGRSCLALACVNTTPDVCYWATFGGC